MPEGGVVGGGAAAAATPGCLHLFVYYKVAEADLADVLTAVASFQAALLADHPPLQASVMRRPGASGGLVTLMETCRFAQPLPPALREELVQGPASLRPWLRSERHLEEFEPCA